jgi:hypothetical protein
MTSDNIRIEIVQTGGIWWAYITQEEWSIHGTGTKDKRTIGRCFRTNPEAWQWAGVFAARIGQGEA